MKLSRRGFFSRGVSGGALLLGLCLLQPAQVTAQPWQGAAFEGDRQALVRLADAGAKVVRVYSESSAWVLDEAARLGLQVVMGLDVGRPAKGFRLDDPQAVRAQQAAILAFVARHREHPALLAWGLGNEVELGMGDPLPAWQEINRLAGLIKAIDPLHPVLMSVSDNRDEWLMRLADCCAEVDLLGLNVYANAVFELGTRLRRLGIGKPVVITEFGALGQWQAGRKPWGAPVEPTSTEKARFFQEALSHLQHEPQIIGAFPFLWGAKHEQTATWHGLLLADGSLTGMTDALSNAWGRSVREPAPQIRGIGLAADVFWPGQTVSAGVDAVAFDQSPLSTAWHVTAEAPDPKAGNVFSVAPPVITVRVLRADEDEISFVAPSAGAYRLFLTVRDRNGKVATANLPFLVQ